LDELALVVVVSGTVDPANRHGSLRCILSRCLPKRFGALACERLDPGFRLRWGSMWRFHVDGV
jgi:hypothetical protein